MRIAILETSSLRGAVGLAEDDQLLAATTLPSDRKHARDLIPKLHELLAGLSWQAGDLELVLVDIGPGSYTGLRVGVMAAKTLAFALACPIVGVDAMRILATQAPTTATDIWTVVDGQQSRLYVSRFARNPSLVCVEPTRLCLIDEWIPGLRPEAYVIGPGLARLRAVLPGSVAIAPESLWDPSIEHLHSVGWSDFVAGVHHEALTLVPSYLRGSSAEEKRRLRLEASPQPPVGGSPSTPSA